ncbi:hypothetical protein A2456_02365 [Candidatus Nomurabacteria bacterium RIFOXYC2_FULL_36_19]|uniref:Methyltransferase type 11 domain-containing protein n=2 Tax=Candidatus Nomuraibacteriota TaxID=1752729 RepID=A0A1F6YVR4_9BACT|nr:MAG: hypothetical protein UR91_C0018G0005 [Candidatus Nomurabacteria bacterium GW2011_GWC2_35_8]OGJ06408.1 MAG: hypothetical protein A2238_01410 [Candidatus Nomurabacteria bacterium RIFOXYA2_FULL_35_9]OGJ10474.1 MAG: hypothetical protein A2456_02365 [Candidatus Nomurabacteria bacterium RIFOXYC2_FULL_36_19]OGJ13807.1 MAG: hypothetical protein A2554_03655 [Candidatus Nomurabacteria bacterium RIFOXYD2_FULL_35_12]
MKERFPKIGEIKKAVEKNTKLATEDGGRYIYKENEWGAYDSPLVSFEITLGAVLPDEEGNTQKSEVFRKYIEKTLSNKGKRDLTAIEFGGPGSELFKGFTPNFFAKTVGVCLADIRNQRKQKEDKRNNHSVIVGDITEITKDKTLTKVTQTLGTNKTDLIISRMEGPIILIDKNPAILDRIIRNWYDLLNKNGLMFIQFELPKYQPRYTEPLIKKWANAIKEKFPEVDIQVNKGVLRLHKRVGAPEKLPPATQLFT